MNIKLLPASTFKLGNASWSRITDLAAICFWFGCHMGRRLYKWVVSAFSTGSRNQFCFGELLSRFHVKRLLIVGRCFPRTIFTISSAYATNLLIQVSTRVVLRAVWLWLCAERLITLRNLVYNVLKSSTWTSKKKAIQILIALHVKYCNLKVSSAKYGDLWSAKDCFIWNSKSCTPF